jgi:ABC-type uncharacterized transport system substrate-binding protein
MKRRDFIRVLGTGAIVTMPGWVARAQQSMPTVGVVSPASSSTTQFPEPFLRTMKELGWEEGRNYRVLFRWAEGHLDRITGIADELVSERVSVIVALGDPTLEAVRRASTTIPIVAMVDDLVKSGLAASVARPGGNITGAHLRSVQFDAKRLELLHEAVPAARKIGVLVDPAEPSTRLQLDEAARMLKLELVVGSARNPEEVAHALDVLETAHVDAVNVLASSRFTPWHKLMIERLNHAGIPAIFNWPETAKEGGFLGYGPRLQLAFRHVAGLVAKILRGAHPDELPVEQPDKIDLVVNLKTAKLLGLMIPPAFLARADEVIE